MFKDLTENLSAWYDGLSRNAKVNLISLIVLAALGVGTALMIEIATYYPQTFAVLFVAFWAFVIIRAVVKTKIQ